MQPVGEKPLQIGEIWAAGAVLVQMATRASASTFVSNLRSTDATTLIYHAKFDEVARELVAGLPNLKSVLRLGEFPVAGAEFGLDAWEKVYFCKK